MFFILESRPFHKLVQWYTKKIQ